MNDTVVGADEPGDLDIVRTISLTSALEAKLERLIIDGELGPGERLNENRLAARFGTSRGPLREATRSLEAKGFLRSIRNRGVYVRQINLEEVLEIYAVRAALFGLAVRLACERMTPLLLEHLARLVAQMSEAVLDDDLDAYYPLNVSFHSAVVAGSQNGTLMTEYGRFVKKMHLFNARGLVEPTALAVSNEEHGAIIAALQAGDPDGAHSAGWAHIKAAQSRLVDGLKASDALSPSGDAGRS